MRLTLAAAYAFEFAVSEHEASGWPDGTGCEAFTVALLRRAAQKAIWPKDREHPTRWIYRHHRTFVVEHPHGDQSDRRLSVNTADDLTRVREYVRIHEAR